ncbi:hypothetical protein GCM10010156_29160 [Planobispora rosea]|uniref:ABC transporter permease n=1 Tax=Planobispora rosea TaxID=35762 RepID=A0A8J3RS68_PLARO|nr:hypothetical protein GCM10010156_29160 [Planobispora rosea]GIH82001.1 hypothetical protein Pro02_04090 [Planobispora rosea]
MTGPTGVTASFATALLSEWTKFRTIRVTGYVLAGAFVVTFCYAYLFGTANGRAYLGSSPAEQASFDPRETAFRALALVQLLVSAVGVLTVTSEYAAGTMPASVTAVPRRGRLVAGKAAVITLIMLVCGPLMALGSFLISQTLLAAQGAPSLPLTAPGVPGSIMGGGLYLTLIGLYGVAMGFLLRRTAGAVTLGSFLLLLPASAPLFPDRLAEWVVTYWPSSAGMSMFAPALSSGSLPSHLGSALLGAAVLALLAGAFAVFRSRDV